MVGMAPAKVSAPASSGASGAAERGGVGVQTGVDRHLVMIMRVIAGGVGREAARRAMLEALVHREDDQLAGTTEAAFHQDAGQIALGTRGVALVVGEDLFDAARDLHDGPGPDWFLFGNAAFHSRLPSHLQR